MMRPPRTAHLAAALISAVAVMVLTLCTTLFLRSYRNAIVEAARTNSAQAVSQVVGQSPSLWGIWTMPRSLGMRFWARS